MKRERERESGKFALIVWFDYDNDDIYMTLT